uniref:Uncharacterized protein n=1 Tax=Ailuropoda melanoleuca TaxID=9646 RepID=A0A7N5K0I4_AILME
MSAEASGREVAETQSLKAPKPLGLEPGSAAYGLKTLTPNSKYAKVNAGCWLHYLALPTLKGQDTDTLLKVVFSGCSEVLTVVGGSCIAFFLCNALWGPLKLFHDPLMGNHLQFGKH